MVIQQRVKQVGWHAVVSTAFEECCQRSNYDLHSVSNVLMSSMFPAPKYRALSL